MERTAKDLAPVDNSAAFDVPLVYESDTESYVDSEFDPTQKKCRKFIDDQIHAYRYRISQSQTVLQIHSQRFAFHSDTSESSDEELKNPKSKEATVKRRRRRRIKVYPDARDSPTLTPKNAPS